MNALPVGPEQVATDETRTRYFENLERWGFDIACVSCGGLSYDDIVGRLHEPYAEFAKEARRRGFTPCIQVPATIAIGDRIGIEEAQYDSSNKPSRLDDGSFRASFASSAWKDYLKEITQYFVRRCGYAFVVFEDPVLVSDIPGPDDRFRARFAETYPGVRYPQNRAEVKEYLLVQQLKSDLLVEFFSDLVAYAKSIGAKKVGILPSLFAPTTENAPEGTTTAYCDTGWLASVAGLDCVIARLQPGHVIDGLVRTGDELATSPQLFYAEILAQSGGTDVIAISSHLGLPDGKNATKPVPADLYRDAALASIAAAPKGFIRLSGVDDEPSMEVLAKAMDCAGRLGRPASPVAFVFSSSGTRHTSPLDHEGVWQRYWSLSKKMAFDARLPMLTFSAETLDRDLAEHPEVKVLVFEEHFPLTIEQIVALRKWWQADIKRAAIAFGYGLGYSADPQSPGEVPCGEAFPGFMELIGLRWEDEPQLETSAPVALKDVSRVRRKAFMSTQDLALTKLANVRRVFGSRATVLYETEVNGNAIPVVTEYRDRTTLAVFCGFGLDEQTSSVAVKAIQFAMAEVDCAPPVVGSCSEGIIWTSTKNGYLVIANLSDKEGQVTMTPGRATIWDCFGQKMLEELKPVATIAPHSFALYRVVGRRSKFFDIYGVSSLQRLQDGAGRAEIDLVAGRSTTFVLRASPREILVNGKSSSITQQVLNGAYHVTLQQCPPGEQRIDLRW